MDYSGYFKTIAAQNRLAADTILMKRTCGIPTATVHIMQHDIIERIAGTGQGSYSKNPEYVYSSMLRNIGINLIVQYIPRNPLEMGDHGYINAEPTATTGASEIVCDGISIDSPEAVAEHLESFEFPRLMEAAANFNEEARVLEILENERKAQEEIGCGILKAGYGEASFPYLHYTRYGYENYFITYALYPEIIEKHFSLQADLARLNNKAVAKAYMIGDLPPLCLLDHDMADSRGTLVDIRSLDRLWFPHFSRCLEPLVNSNIRLLWHCDGNLMNMLPRLIEVGIKGFQGFQYEDGMDYEKICGMKAKDGEGLFIWAGVSVTRTLPFGKPSDVKREIDWLVEKGPKTGLVLSTSSSVTPGTPWENIQTMIEGFEFYRKGRV